MERTKTVLILIVTITIVIILAAIVYIPRDSSKPSAPANLTVNHGVDGLTLVWDEPTSSGDSEIIKYGIYRGTTSSDKILIGNSSDELTYVDSLVSWDTTYYYQITAQNAEGEGPRSNEVVFSTNPITYAPSPWNLQANVGDGQVNLSWSPSGYIVDYDGLPIIEYYMVSMTTGSWDMNTDWIFVGNTTLTYYTCTNITNGVLYSFIVTSCNELGPGTGSVIEATPTSS